LLILALVRKEENWGQGYKTFLSVIYGFLQQARVFVPGKFFQPSLMLASKAGAYPRVEQLKGQKSFITLAPGQKQREGEAKKVTSRQYLKKFQN
jgi:hypothetical protein